MADPYVLPVAGANLGRSNYGASGSRWASGRHTGVDFAVPVGTSVVSARDGVVVRAEWSGSYGFQVSVRHNDGTFSTYSHLSQMLAAPGAQVKAGQVIAKSGSTGNSTGPHLHFEVRMGNDRYGNDIDPVAWLTQGSPMAIPQVEGMPTGETAQGQQQEEQPVAQPAEQEVARGEMVAAESRSEMVAAESRTGLGVSPDLTTHTYVPAQVASGEPVTVQEVMSGPTVVGAGGGGGTQSGGDLYQLALGAGFTEAQARTMAAIAKAESGGNARAFNGNRNTGDESYGLWQINMLGSMGPNRRAQFGITNNDQLFDPTTNALAAFKIFQQQGFNAWSVYKSGAYKRYL